MLATENEISEYLNVNDESLMKHINQSLLTLYMTHTISYFKTKDNNINTKDLESLQRLLNISKTNIQTSNDHHSIFGPIRPTAFLTNSQTATYSNLDIFLHELITDNSITWLTGMKLSDLRDRNQDITTFQALIK